MRAGGWGLKSGEDHVRWKYQILCKHRDDICRFFFSAVEFFRGCFYERSRLRGCVFGNALPNRCWGCVESRLKTAVRVVRIPGFICCSRHCFSCSAAGLPPQQPLLHCGGKGSPEKSTPIHLQTFSLSPIVYTFFYYYYYLSLFITNIILKELSWISFC